MTTNKGDRIKNLRINNKMTLEEVGEKIGVSKQTLYKYENNIITNIPSDKIEGLAKVFNISPAVIMGWDKDEQSTKKNPNAQTSTNMPVNNSKDERDIQKRLQSILDDLDSSAALSFYNGDQEMDEDTKNLLRISLENSIRLAKERAKQKFTPNKYKNK